MMNGINKWMSAIVVLAASSTLSATEPKMPELKNWRADGVKINYAPPQMTITFKTPECGAYPQVRRSFPGGLAGYNQLSCEIKSNKPLGNLSLILWSNGQRAIAPLQTIAKIRVLPADEWIKMQWNFRKEPGWITPPRSTPFDFDNVEALAFSSDTRRMPENSEYQLEIRNIRFESGVQIDSKDAAERAEFIKNLPSGSKAGKKAVVWANDGTSNGYTLNGVIKSLPIYKSLPIDGVSMDMAPAPFRDRFFTPDDLDEKAMLDAVDLARSTDWGNLKNNFFRVNIAGMKAFKNADGTEKTLDWFDDALWIKISDKLTRFAAAAKQAGFHIMFDTEAYTTEPFDYFNSYKNSGKSYAEYEAMVRKRGRQVAEAFAKGSPGETVMMMFSNWVVEIAPELDRYGLITAFVDGMCEAGSDLNLIDGYEGGYEFTNRASVASGLYNIKKVGVNRSSVPDKYRKGISGGFGVWLRPAVMSGAEFGEMVGHSLELSDGYVWIYLAGAPITDVVTQKYLSSIRR